MAAEHTRAFDFQEPLTPSRPEVSPAEQEEARFRFRELVMGVMLKHFGFTRSYAWDLSAEGSLPGRGAMDTLGLVVPLGDGTGELVFDIRQQGLQEERRRDILVQRSDGIHGYELSNYETNEAGVVVRYDCLDPEEYTSGLAPLRAQPIRPDELSRLGAIIDLSQPAPYS